MAEHSCMTCMYLKDNSCTETTYDNLPAFPFAKTRCKYWRLAICPIADLRKAARSPRPWYKRLIFFWK